MKLKIAHPAANSLGEGPIWHPERRSILWIDILEKNLYELTWESQQLKSWKMPAKIGTVAIESKNSVIVALQGGIARFNLDSEALDYLAELETTIETNRPNDGKCDSEGRLWQGTIDLDCAKEAGALYCFDGENCNKKLGNLTISNGMAWSLDNQRFYFIDSPTFCIDAYLFDAKSAKITFERTVIKVPESMGLPDGMTIDSDGMLWVALWGGFAVGRWNPHTGDLLETIELPVPQVTSCTFGGKDWDELFITTARVGMSDEALAQYPESGHLFIQKMSVKGIESFKFGKTNE